MLFQFGLILYMPILPQNMLSSKIYEPAVLSVRPAEGPAKPLFFPLD
jgi:hypothetical protein